MQNNGLPFVPFASPIGAFNVGNGNLAAGQFGNTLHSHTSPVVNEPTATRSVVAVDTGRRDHDPPTDVVENGNPVVALPVQNSSKIQFRRSMSEPQQKEWIIQFTLDDVEVDQNNKTDVGCDEPTILKSIGGVSPNLIHSKVLIEFIKKHKMKQYSNLKYKNQLCDRIARAKSYDSAYKDPPRRRGPNKKSNVSGSNKKNSNNTSQASRKPKATKSDKPVAVTKEATFYRVINTFFCDEHRDDVLELGKAMRRTNVDAPQWAYQHIFDKLVKSYNCNSPADPNYIASIGVLNEEHALFGEIDMDEFDILTGTDFKECFDYLKCHFGKAKTNKTTSGTHEQDFSNFIGSKTFLMYFYLCLQRTPDLYQMVDGNIGAAKTEIGSNNNNPIVLEREPKRRRHKKTSADELGIYVDRMTDAANQRSQAARNQADSFLSLAREKHKLEKWEQLRRHLSSARDDLKKALENHDDNSDNSEVQGAKADVAFWTRRKDAFKKQLEDEANATLPAVVTVASTASRSSSQAPNASRSGSRTPSSAEYIESSDDEDEDEDDGSGDDEE